MSIALSYLLGAHTKHRSDADAERALIPPAAEHIAKMTLRYAVEHYRHYTLRVNAHNRAYPNHKWPLKGLREYLNSWRSYWWLADWYAAFTVQPEYKAELMHRTNQAIKELVAAQYGWVQDVTVFLRPAPERRFNNQSWRLN